jgi:plasmid stabilization system protein ParE
MSSVTFAQSAETDLLEAWTFIAEQSFEAADHVLDGADSCRLLVLK